jgi:hypothetical protein
MYHQFSLSGSESPQTSKSSSVRSRYARFCAQTVAGLSALSIVLASCQAPAFASPSCVTTQQDVGTKTGLVSQSLSDRFDSLPAGKILKQRPNDVKIYEYDREPLGDRAPFLMVHGLRGEYYPYFRWQKVAERLNKSKDFATRYKIYLLRYSTLDRIDSVLPKFKEALNGLYLAGKQRPISLMALSMGGNISFEASQDKAVDDKIRMIFTMGTPFHGSPLFAKEWMSYTVYKRLSWPWSRIDHNLAFKLYFRKNPNLQKDLTWDNSDEAIPEVGKFWSKMPFGPSGRLTISDTTNFRLAKINEAAPNKHKLITYGGYISSPYLSQGAKRYIERAFMYPYFLVSSTVPAHFAREHPVLGILNREITNVQVTKQMAKQAGTPFVYALNDGITPVSSAIFLPKAVAQTQLLGRELDLEKVRDKVDVGLARCFRNIDHLTFIDGVRPVNPIIALVNPLVRDELNPKDGQKEIFDWIVGDIQKFDLEQSKLVDRRIQALNIDRAIGNKALLLETNKESSLSGENQQEANKETSVSGSPLPTSSSVAPASPSPSTLTAGEKQPQVIQITSTNKEVLTESKLLPEAPIGKNKEANATPDSHSEAAKKLRTQEAENLTTNQ